MISEASSRLPGVPTVDGWPAETQPKYMKRALMRLKPHNLLAMSTILDATMVGLCNSAVMGSLNNVINERHSALQPIFVFTRVITYCTIRVILT